MFVTCGSVEARKVVIREPAGQQKKMGVRGGTAPKYPYVLTAQFLLDDGFA
jgi:hypothetical protein